MSVGVFSLIGSSLVSLLSTLVTGSIVTFHSQFVGNPSLMNCAGTLTAIVLPMCKGFLVNVIVISFECGGLGFLNFSLLQLLCCSLKTRKGLYNSLNF